MPLNPDARLGPYIILAPLGAGGMGEVYRAKDTRLDRDVAIKVLPEQMARDAERVARFQREAKVLAALNHPNIAAIHGFEEAEGKRFLVLEFVDGRTLAERLDAGPVPIDEALDVARQIAEAVEAAHEQGIVHRDLKPSNVKISPEGKVKVLDFGLAKALGSDPSHTDAANSPTLTADFTRKGVILGTAAYMSPEQARGRSVDKRSDIWSFGCVLYECLTGMVLFRGETATDSIGAILHKEPDWAALPPNTPPTIQLLLRRCLTKDRNRRLHDIADARIEIENAIADPTASSLSLGQAVLSGALRRRAARRSAIPWAAAITLALVAGGSLTALWRATRPMPRLPVHMNVEVSPDKPLQSFSGAQMALSPDGATLVYAAGEERQSGLFLRRLNQLESTPLPGTNGGWHPFFSSDGQWVAFFADGKLKKVSVSGGAPLTLCDARNARGGTWTPDDAIIFSPDVGSGLWRVPAAGGVSEELTKLDKDKKERSHRWPHVLPDGKHVIFTAQAAGRDFNSAEIEIVSMVTGERKVIHRGGAYARYLPTGHLVYVREGTLFAAPFDHAQREVTGTPAPILEGVTFDSRNGGTQFAFADSGTLVYHAGPQAVADTSIVWVDRQGTVTPLLADLRNYGGLALSPDGRQLAVAIFAPESSELDIWIYDLERTTLGRFTFGDRDERSPVWSPDGRFMAFSSTTGGVAPKIYRRPVDGSADPERLLESEQAQWPSAWSPDGKTLVYLEWTPETQQDIWVLPLEGERKPVPFLVTRFNEASAVLSPDGRWLAYRSDESGRGEVYVRPFPQGAGKWQISTEGGNVPHWSHDGSELFYRLEDKSMVVSIKVEGGLFQAGKPQALFEFASSGFFGQGYDVAPDGQRFVFVKPEKQENVDRAHLRFIFNWFDEVRAKVPTGAR